MLFTLQRYEFFSKSQHVFDDNEKGDRCCLPYKGTNFSANHNVVELYLFNALDVVYPTKVRIFQQITTKMQILPQIEWMLFTLQRYEFFSKSQRVCANISPVRDVVYPTKVRIFQQITTRSFITPFSISMLFTLQRYEFFSKSQQIRGSNNSIPRCCLPYKGTNFSANHNHPLHLGHPAHDVVYPTKVRIFQQITTDFPL